MPAFGLQIKDVFSKLPQINGYQGRYYSMKIIKLILIFSFAAIWLIPAAGCKDDFMQRLYRKTPKPEYTRDDPGEWAGMEDDHIPVVTFYPDREPDIVVRVNLQNPTAIHYIEKIGIMDEKRNDLVCKEFRSVDKIFEAQFYSANIPGNKKNLKVYAKCSLHDL